MLNAQWMQTSGPGGGRVLCLTERSGNIYAGSEGGVFVSDDRGSSWSAMNNGLSNREVRSLATTGSKLLALTATAGIMSLSSTDASWRSAHAGLSGVLPIDMHVSKDNVLARTDAGIFASTDEGDSWIPVLTLDYPKRITAIAAFDTSLVAISMDGSIYSSPDHGLTWTITPNVVPGGYVSALAMTYSLIVAGGDEGIYISSDDGSTWTHSLSASECPLVTSIVISEQDVFVGCLEGMIFHSADAGQSWQRIDDTRFLKTVNAMLFSVDRLVVATADGLYMSTDSGVTWMETSAGLSSTTVRNIATNNDNIFACTWNKLYRADDEGRNWSTVLEGKNFLCLASSERGLFAGTMDEGVFFSIDDGTTWNTINDGLALPTSIYSIITYEMDVFIGSNEGVFVLSGDEQSWKPLNQNFPHGARPYNGILASNEERIIAACDDGMYLTRDKGETWTLLDTRTEVLCLALNESCIFVATNNGICVSKDEGASWSCDGDLPNVRVQTLLTIGSIVLAGTERLGVFLSTDDGDTWSSFNNGLPDTVTVYDLGVSTDRILAGIDHGGVWSIPLSGVTGIINDKYHDMSCNVHLLGNYPNPFSQSTTIPFNIERSGRVSLVVYDVLGREILTLVDGYLTAGMHHYVLNTRLPRGMYMYLLRAGNRSEYRLMTVH